MKHIKFIFIFFVISFTLSSQNFGNIKAKEQFDAFNAVLVNNISPCTINPNLDGDDFGDGQSFIFDSYVNMYKATKDKAYLYKCMFEIMCVVKNRHDIAGLSSEPRWGSPYQDGNIIGSMARFVYLLKKELPFNPHQPFHVFSKFQSYDWNQPENYPYPKNPNTVNITTFWLFADWLGHRIDEVLDWYIANGTFDVNKGLLENQNNGVSSYLNMQVGFARAALLNGITDPNTCCYIPRANSIVSNIKGGVAFTDRCEGFTYNQNVLRYESSANSYWWYHSGWAVQRIDCLDGSSIFRPKEPRFSKYIEFVEDLKHGAVDLMLFKDFHYFHGGIFTADMIRFRNTFTKMLYNSTTNSFNNAVNGSDGPIQHNDCKNCPHNYLKLWSMCYMSLEEYDGLDNTSVAPNAYDIIMNFYLSEISSLPSAPSGYDGFANKGHADVVAAQWKHECTNLELYNRNVVYNQDFFANNKLIITPESNLSGTLSYAEPIITTPEFIVQNTVTVNMWGGESVTLKPGVQIKSGSTFKAFVVPSLACTDGARMASNTGSGKTQPNELPITNPIEESSKQLVNKNIKLRAVPNPFSSSTNIHFSLDKESKVNLKLVDNFGRIVYESKEDVFCNTGFNEILISTESLAQGLYNCILKINNEEVKTINIVKQ